MLRRTLVLSTLLVLLVPAVACATQVDIVHINVGQGAATLILGPTDASDDRVSVLIDAGGLPTGGKDGGEVVAEALSGYGVSQLDYFIASHYHADHIGGLAAGPYHGNCFMFGLDGAPGTTEDDDEDGNANWEADGEPDLDELGLGAFHDDILVDIFVDRGTVGAPDTGAYDKYEDVRATAQIGTVTLADQQDVNGYGIDLGASGATQATLTCLAANGYVRNRGTRVAGTDDENERSLCFLLSFGDFHYLIGGDLTGGGTTQDDGDAEVEQAVANYISSLEPPVTIDVLAVNHHGSRYSSSSAFLTDVSPTLAVISVGDGNGYGHPHLEALQRLYDAGVQTIYQTEWGSTVGEVPHDIEQIRAVFEGSVVVTSDGQSFWVVRFPDIMPYHWAFDEVEACADAGVVGGYDDGLYHPANPVDRGQMSVFIARSMAGGDENVPDGPATATFGDVPTDYWAYKYVEYCVAEGVVGGYNPVTYAPAVIVSRDQMSVFISRAVADGDQNVPDGPATATFDDVPTDHWAFKYVEYCVENGIVGGYSPTTYAPTITVTRDQMAVFICRGFDLPS